MTPIGTDKTIIIRDKVDCIMAEHMEMGLPFDRRDFLPGNALLMNNVRYLITKREPPIYEKGGKVFLYMSRDHRTRQQRQQMKKQRRTK